MECSDFSHGVSKGYVILTFLFIVCSIELMKVTLGQADSVNVDHLASQQSLTAASSKACQQHDHWWQCCLQQQDHHCWWSFDTSVDCVIVIGSVNVIVSGIASSLVISIGSSSGGVSGGSGRVNRMIVVLFLLVLILSHALIEIITVPLSACFLYCLSVSFMQVCLSGWLCIHLCNCVKVFHPTSASL